MRFPTKPFAGHSKNKLKPHLKRQWVIPQKKVCRLRLADGGGIGPLRGAIGSLVASRLFRRATLPVTRRGKRPAADRARTWPTFRLALRTQRHGPRAYGFRALERLAKG